MPGRILLVTSNFPRWEGDSTTPFVLHLAMDLQAEGWKVDVLAPGAERALPKERIAGVLVERFPYLWPPSAQTVCYGGGALVNLRGNPLNWAKLPPLVVAEIVATMRRLRARAYDLLHTHWILPQGFTGAVVSRMFGIPHVATVHGGDVFGLQGALLQPFKRHALQGAAAVTCNGSATADAVRTIAPKLRSVDVIPMGVDMTARPSTDLVQALRAQHRRGNGPLVLFVGRLVEEKGVGDLIAAVAATRDQLPDIAAVIVGEGPHRALFERLAVETGVADRVSFAGWVDPADIPSHFAAADILAAPSRRAPDGWVEAQGLSIAEGMAAGLPVVATRTGGIPDVVTDGRTGLLVPEGEPAEISAAIQRLWSDPALTATLAKEAKSVAETRFSRKATARRFSDLFHNVLADRDGSRLAAQRH